MRFRNVRRGPVAAGGFSLVEMMVVVTILLMAFGLMVPSLAEFFKNRELETVSGEFTSAFNTARMQAVVNGRPFYVVFFREGPRIFDTKLGKFKDDEQYDPRRAPAASPDIHYDLFFAGQTSDALPRYEDWEAQAKGQAERRQRGRARRDPRTREATDDVERLSADGLVRIAFDRDGTLRFDASGGNDITTAKFRAEPPQGADIVIWQRDNAYASFVDLQPTGAIKSKISPSSEITSLRPPPLSAEAQHTGSRR